MNTDAVIALASLVVGTIGCIANVVVVFRKPEVSGGSIVIVNSPVVDSPGAKVVQGDIGFGEQDVPAASKFKTQTGPLAWNRVLAFLTRWLVYFTTGLVASVIVLSYQVWFSGSVNRWFLRIHMGLAIIASATGVILIVLLWRGKSNRGTQEAESLATVVLALLFLYSFVNFGWHFVEWESLYSSAKMQQAGFESFNSEHYETAVTIAQECVDDFGNAATDLEKTMVDKQFPTGRVSGPVKTEIFKDGVLNDVGACSWIAARSMQKLRRIDEAKKAYNKVLEFPHARVWDPPFFWSPAEDAQDRLKDL